MNNIDRILDFISLRERQLHTDIQIYTELGDIYEEEKQKAIYARNELINLKKYIHKINSLELDNA